MHTITKTQDLISTQCRRNLKLTSAHVSFRYTDRIYRLLHLVINSTKEIIQETTQ